MNREYTREDMRMDLGYGALAGLVFMFWVFQAVIVAGTLAILFTGIWVYYYKPDLKIRFLYEGMRVRQLGYRLRVEVTLLRYHLSNGRAVLLRRLPRLAIPRLRMKGS